MIAAGLWQRAYHHRRSPAASGVAGRTRRPHTTSVWSKRPRCLQVFHEGRHRLIDFPWCERRQAGFDVCCACPNRREKSCTKRTPPFEPAGGPAGRLLAKRRPPPIGAPVQFQRIRRFVGQIAQGRYAGLACERPFHIAKSGGSDFRIGPRRPVCSRLRALNSIEGQAGGGRRA